MGPWITYYKNGNTHEELEYSETGILNGKCKFYNEEGKILLEGAYLNGFRHGEYREYHVNGKVASKITFVNGSQAESKYFDEEGNPQE